MESQTAPLPFVPAFSPGPAAAPLGFPVPFRPQPTFGSPVGPPPAGKIHVALPRAMWPKGFGVEATAFEKKYGGKLIYIFAVAIRDEAGRMVKPGYLAHVLIETDAPASVKATPLTAQPEPKDPKLASFVRGLARMTARAWAASACEYQEVVG